MAHRGAVEDVKEAQLDMDVLHQIMNHLDVDGDGEVSKEEFKVPWMKLFPKMKDADFEKVWIQIDTDGSNTLSMQELAVYYGFSLSPNAKRGGGDANMSDDQILEALQLSAALAEMAEEKEAKLREIETKKDEGTSVGSFTRRGSRKFSFSSGSDGIRAAMATPFDRDQKKKSSGVGTVKMPGKITMEVTDPDVLFFQMCELGDEKAIQEALKNTEQRIRIEDDKGEMPIHKLARQGCLDSVREVLDSLQKTDSVKTDLNWQDKQGKTPLFYAIEYGHLKLVQLFLDRGADVMVENNNGWTVLHTAVQADSIECAEIILSHPRVKTQKQRLIDTADKSNRTALHIASFKSKEGDMVTFLLRNGADPHAKDSSGNTSFKLAEKTGRRKSKELLEESMQAAVKTATTQISVVKAFGGGSVLGAVAAK